MISCNSHLNLINSVLCDYVLGDRLGDGICKHPSSLINGDPVAYNYINNVLAEANMLCCFPDVVACLSPAYTGNSIDADRQPAPVDHAFMASSHHLLQFFKRPKAKKMYC